jgi:heterodisulfide reductase subunit C
MDQTINLNHLKNDPLKLSIDNFQTCQTCGLCSSACPVAGVENFDPRKVVRMLALGLTDELVAAKWPWICTMCGKCSHLCPMEIDIADIVRHIRARRERDQVPGVLHKGVATALKTGNNLGVPKDDYLFVVEDVAEEIAQEPGFENFKLPIDKKDANILATVHNKLINTHNEDLKHWWKIFYAAGEDWTITSENWEGCNWGYFTGDNEAMRTMAGRVAGQMERLKVKNLLWCE